MKKAMGEARVASRAASWRAEEAAIETIKKQIDLPSPLEQRYSSVIPAL